jgi:AcrR family transcriptional regulator
VAAALNLLSLRGQDGLTLREITEQAGANVAAVSYHFGSLQALCDVAIEHALESYLDAQIQATTALKNTATVEELAAAFARPMMSALAAGGQELAIMRTVARAGIDPPQGWDRLAGKFNDSRRDTVRVLSSNLPGVDEQELTFRIRCAAGMLNWLALAPLGAELAGQPAANILQLLVPVLAGALYGRPGAS